MIQKTILDNGIRILTEQMPGVHSVTLGVWVLTGSRHESQDQNGVTHFFEHMLFKGTERRSSRDIALEIDSVGGVLNAFTSREYCCFHARILAGKLPLAINLLADILLNSRLDLDEIEKERRVILQEILILEDNSEDLVHDLFARKFWLDDPLGLPIQGTFETVKNLSRKVLRRYIDAHFLGENLLICAAGNLDHQDVVARLGDAFGDVQRGGVPPLPSFPQGVRGLDFVDRDLEQIHFCLGTQTLPQSHPEHLVSCLLNTILGASMSCRLFQKIREEQGLVYSIYSYLNCHSDAGALVVYSATREKNVPLVVRLVLKEMKRMKMEPVSEPELISAKEHLKGNLLLSVESTDSRMIRLAKNQIYLGKNPSLQSVLDKLDRIGSDEIMQLANKIFQNDRLNLQMVGRINKIAFPFVDLTLD